MAYKILSMPNVWITTKGRHQNITLNERICKLCKLEIEDEIHFSLQCPILNSFRTEAMQQISDICKNFASYLLLCMLTTMCWFNNNLITSHQSGFTPGDSAVNQLLYITNEFDRALNEGKEVRVVFCDCYSRINIGQYVIYENNEQKRI
jgi:hypothetical protein